MPIVSNFSQKPIKMKHGEYLKHVENYLGRHFPNCPFILSTKRYKGGKSLRVTWTDGPETDSLRGLQEVYSGAEIGMGRMKTKTECIMTFPTDILRVNYGFDFIILNRKTTVSVSVHP